MGVHVAAARFAHARYFSLMSVRRVVGAAGVASNHPSQHCLFCVGRVRATFEDARGKSLNSSCIAQMRRIMRNKYLTHLVHKTTMKYLCGSQNRKTFHFSRRRTIDKNVQPSELLPKEPTRSNTATNYHSHILRAEA